MATRSSRQEHTQIRETVSEDPACFDPYRVLKVSKGASAEEIREAFETETMRYHPGRLNGLGEEIAFLAKRKAGEVTRAYQQLMAELNQSSSR